MTNTLSGFDQPTSHKLPPRCGWFCIAAVWLAGALPALAALTPEQIRKLPPPADHRVDFAREIQPILEASCIKCHGRGRTKGDFQVDNRETMLKGGASGPAVRPGHSAESYLIELVSGLNPDLVMPEKGSKLTPAQVGLLRAWIDQGLLWDSQISLGRRPPVNLFPRRPPLPPKTSESASDNPIDRLLTPYFAAHHFQPPNPVADRVFARRVYLDVIGLLPAPAQLEAFQKDQRPDKRAQLIARLLADRRQYAEHWLTFWNDALRNDYQGTGYIDGGRKQITPWLFAALARNLPYDQFVAQLINPSAECDGFTRGIIWRGVVNASQTPQMQAAQNISQVFLGINLKCASCHDSFINDWTLADSYGLAAVYSDGPLEMVHCDKPTGRKATVKFLYPELGAIGTELNQAERRQRLAQIITQRQDGRLARTIVNRFWARFLGRGLVEPADEMDNPAWNQDLLDWLASDLSDHGYDLQHTIALILTSQAYQLPTVGVENPQRKDFEFRGPLVRRLEAEQYLDAVSTLTGVWHKVPANSDIDFDAGSEPAVANSPPGNPRTAKWIGPSEDESSALTNARFYLRKAVYLDAAPAQALVVCSGDARFTLYVNGVEVASGNNYRQPRLVGCAGRFHAGENVIAARLNGPAEKAKKSEDRPLGLLLYARLRGGEPAGAAGSEQVWDFVSDASWMGTTNEIAGWEQPDFIPSSWDHVCELGPPSAAPWRLEHSFLAKASSTEVYDQVRAALVNNDSLMAALGRPNREQTVTSRPSAATTLEALELTNGATLADELRRGAENLLAAPPQSGADMVKHLYRAALDRPPTASELDLATGLLGDPIRPAGVEDLLWAVIMLPEFQLIY